MGIIENSTLGFTSHSNEVSAESQNGVNDVQWCWEPEGHYPP